MSKKKKQNIVQKICHELGCTIEKLFMDAAAWAKREFNRSLPPRAIRAAIAKFERTHTIPDWVGKYLASLGVKPA